MLREFNKDPNLVCLSRPLIYYALSIWTRILVNLFYGPAFATYLINRFVLRVNSLVQGGNFVIKKAALERVAGFDKTIDFYGNDTDVTRPLNKVGHVKFTFALPVYASGRRLAREGTIMINKFLLFLVLLGIVVPVTVKGEMTGRQVMEEYKRRHEVQTECAVEIMLLVDRKGSEEKRLVKTYAKDMGNDLDRSLLVFMEPARVRGTAMLTWEQEDRDDDQWLYLPSQKKMRRIAQTSKKSYFMGTDFTYEDLEPEEIDDYNYEILRSEEIEGNKCYVIEAVPVNEQKKKESGYSKRALWVRKDIFFPVKIEFYDRRGQHIKTLTNCELVNLEGPLWRANKSLMEKHKKKHKTLVGVISRKINVPIDNFVFTERYVMSERHLE